MSVVANTRAAGGRVGVERPGVERAGVERIGVERLLRLADLIDWDRLGMSMSAHVVRPSLETSFGLWVVA